MAVDINNYLVIIPARKNSKGIPGKNKKHLNGKALIAYTIEAALDVFPIDHICVNTDDEEIVKIAENYSIKVPFLRPSNLAEDSTSMQEVLLHTIEWYKNKGLEFKYIVLLQPTSPFRKKTHIQEALNSHTSHMDMLVSVMESKANPYFNLMEEGADGYLSKSKPSVFTSRQDAPKVYELNGAIYVIKTNSLLMMPMSQFTLIEKYVMSPEDSVDIDEPQDWKYAEFIFRESKI